jgi:hypothetical protein
LKGWDLIFAKTYDEIIKYLGKIAKVPYHGKFLLNNAFIAGLKGHVFWKMCIEEIIHGSTQIPEHRFYYAVYVAKFAGPELVCKVLFKYLVDKSALNNAESCKVKMYDSEYFEPRLRKIFNKHELRKKEDYQITENTHAIHYFAKSWLMENPWHMGEIGISIVGIFVIVGIILVIGISIIIGLKLKMSKTKKFKQIVQQQE